MYGANSVYTNCVTISGRITLILIGEPFLCGSLVFLYQEGMFSKGQITSFV